MLFRPLKKCRGEHLAHGNDGDGLAGPAPQNITTTPTKRIGMHINRLRPPASVFSLPERTACTTAKGSSAASLKIKERRSFRAARKHATVGIDPAIFALPRPPPQVVADAASRRVLAVGGDKGLAAKNHGGGGFSGHRRREFRDDTHKRSEQHECGRPWCRTRLGASTHPNSARHTPPSASVTEHGANSDAHRARR